MDMQRQLIRSTNRPHKMANAQRLCLGLVGLLLAAPLLFIPLVDHESRSKLENRALAKFPEFTWSALDGRYQTELVDYFGDHMAFSRPLTQTLKLAQYRLLDTIQNERIVLAKESKVPILNGHALHHADIWGAFSYLCRFLTSQSMQNN